MSKALKSMAILMVAAACGAASVALAADNGGAIGDDNAAPRAERGGFRGGFAQKRLKRMDTDRNGSVSKDEFMAERFADFKDTDTNHDAVADPAEIGAVMAEPASFRTKRFMKRTDANRDGKITREEFELGPRAQFAARDINNDGKLNAEDRPPSNGSGWFGGSDNKRMGLGRGNRPDQTLDTVVQRSQAEFAKIDANSDGTLDADEISKQTTARIEFAKKRLMHVADANNDGKLTEDEFSARAAKRFSNMDLNDDGQIDGKDFPASTRQGWFSR